MKVTYQVSNKMMIEVEGKTQKDVFKQLSEVSEVFGESICQNCKSEAVRFRVRNVQDNDFYELYCMNCHARLQFGSHKKGDTLFPKRTDANGQFLDNRGWVKWKKTNGGTDSQDITQTAPPVDAPVKAPF
jgi:hypothetical protein